MLLVIISPATAAVARAWHDARSRDVAIMAADIVEVAREPDDSRRVLGTLTTLEGVDAVEKAERSEFS